MAMENSYLQTVVDQVGAAILDIDRGQVSKLNPTGAFVWQRLQRGETIEEVIANLACELPGSRKILILETGSSHCFPSVRILKGTRIARELQRAVQDTWKLDVIVLDLPKPVCADNILYAVAEVRLSKRPFGLRAIDIAELRGVGLNKKLRGRLV